MSKPLAALQKLFHSAIHALLYPPLRVIIILAVSASLLFILYFEFLYGPVPATLFVLAYLAYAGTVVFLGLRSYARLAENPENDSLPARLLRRDDLRGSLSSWGRAAFNLLYALFCLLAKRIGNTHSFDAPGLYSLVIVVISLLIGSAKRRNALRPESSERRDRRFMRLISVLLLLLALVFAAITAGAIIDSKDTVWLTFVLTFQVLFTGLRLILYGTDAIRSIGTGNTLAHMISDVNLSIVLVALYTTVNALLGRFCSDRGTFLVLSVIAGSLILCAVLYVAVCAFRRAWGHPEPAAEDTLPARWK